MYVRARPRVVRFAALQDLSVVTREDLVDMVGITKRSRQIKARNAIVDLVLVVRSCTPNEFVHYYSLRCSLSVYLTSKTFGLSLPMMLIIW